MMKLYHSPSSNFGMRVMIAARAKGLEFEILLPDGGLRSPGYLALNPVAKIPVLVTEQGTIIAESIPIIEYLEERFPKPSLRACDADANARINVVTRVVDTYLMAPVIRLFPHLDPAARDAAVVAAEVRHWTAGAAALAHFLTDPLPETEATLTIADCALAPSLLLSTRIARMLDLPADPVHAHPVLNAYAERMEAHPVAGPVLEQLKAAQAAKT